MIPGSILQIFLKVSMTGRMELSLDYGHSGRFRFSIHKDLDLFIPLDISLPFSHADHLPTESTMRKESIFDV